jgi:broad specificity phosphatase PhoE
MRNDYNISLNVQDKVKIYFVRHGESVANVLGEFSNSGYKHPLTSLGIEQARLLGESLTSFNISRIFTSPVLRAVQTAEILSRILNAKVEITEALREWSLGIFEGTRDESGWAMHRQVLEDWLVHRRLDSKIPGGESYLEIKERFVPFIDQLVQEGQNTDKNVVLVGHGGLYITMLPVIFKNIDYEFSIQHTHFPNTGYALGETRPDGLYCVSWCGTPIQG